MIKKKSKGALENSEKRASHGSMGHVHVKLSFPSSESGLMSMNADLTSKSLSPAKLQVVLDRGSDTGSVGLVVEGHSMSVLAEGIHRKVGTSTFSASFDSISTAFSFERGGSIHGLFRPQLMRMQHDIVRTGFLRYLLNTYRGLPVDQGPSLAIFLQPLVTLALARQRSYADSDAGQGPPFFGILDPLTVFRRLPITLGILMQAGPSVGPGPAPVPVPGDPPPPDNIEKTADEIIATWITAANQLLVGWSYVVNGLSIRIASFVPSAWAPSGPRYVDNTIVGPVASQTFTRTVRITFEQVRTSKLCVTRRCPGSCWGTNDTTQCKDYATVLKSWTQTVTETRVVSGFSAAPGGGGTFVTPPAAGDPPDINNVSPAPTPP